MLRLAGLSVFGFWWVVGLAACGDDGVAAPDGGGVGTDCTGMPDGVMCAEDLICISESCTSSTCGDGFVNPMADEDCEDGNEVSGDGCEPTSCTFSCSDAAGCDDGDPCNGAEACNEVAHRCQAGELPTEVTTCTQEGGASGVCGNGLCRDPGCGNGATEASEECDDGNDVEDDGCKSDCSFSCTMDEDCANGDACDGEETCNVATHVCEAQPAPDCDDVDACTADGCDMELGCTHDLIDIDSDGFAAPTCTTVGLMGGDCNDTNSTVYPGAPELCDTLDNDCNMMVDDGTVSVECRMDRDGDGYGDDSASMSTCSCPAGTIPPRSDGKLDCRDTLMTVNPGITGYSTTAHCSGRICGTDRPYDWNCNGVEEQQYTRTNSTGCSRTIGLGGIISCSGTGWTGSSVPACGRTATLRKCSFRFGIGGSTCSQTFLGLDIQGCR